MANYPVIVGAGQFTNHAQSLDGALEPLELMARAARSADEDAGGGLLAALDSLQVVNILGWPYPDAPGLLSERLGASPAQKVYTAVGGETPQRLVNETAEAIVRGETRLALIAGAEAMNSRRLARRADVHLPWPIRGNPEHVVGDTRPGFSDIEARHGTVAPVRVYPLFENAIRANAARTVDEHQAHLGRLCAAFTAVAAKNPYAWFPQERSPDELTEVNAGNRWVCFPYPKRMNAIMEVDQGAALIMTGSETARELGIPEEKWVYVRGCGQANDKWLVSDRVNYHTSPAIRAAISRALDQAGLTVDDIDMFDIYSCFPAAVQLGADALGISTDDPRGLTLTGGLPYFGGPGNNYVSHSIAAAVERLRAEPEKKALLTGLGWFSTKHSAGVYSSTPPTGKWVRTDPKEDQETIEVMESPSVVDAADGKATIETYTVAFGREGEPETGIVIGRLADGTRFWANTPSDTDLMLAMTREEFVGRDGTVAHDAATQRNIFTPR
ncbi:MAG TPA: acetyl-CoA acetyltransferase [Dehalococcoidia bacterium]|nr:acetyl-CoA acetyltransferase [Dehalococcoidia bacterium]